MKKHETSSEFLRHEPCPSCGSKDNLARYTDGHAYCFGCDHYEAATDAEPTTIKKEKIISDDFNSYRSSSCSWYH